MEIGERYDSRRKIRCAALISLTLGAAPPSLGSGVLWSTGATNPVLEIHVGTGNVNAYENTWNVSAYTPGNPNTGGRYGTNHKPVNIMP